MPIEPTEDPEVEIKQPIQPFHLAINVTDLNSTRSFYGGILGATEGRSTSSWVDFDLFGHQISFHIGPVFQTENSGVVGKHMVPMPHFGLVLPLHRWREMADRLIALKVDFVIPPSVRFEGQPGEQWIMFFTDPSGNPIELKGFGSLDKLFLTD